MQIGDEIIESLMKFESSSKMEQEALLVLVQMLNYRAIKELKEAFIKLDADNSGYLSYQEI